MFQVVYLGGQGEGEGGGGGGFTLPHFNIPEKQN